MDPKNPKRSGRSAQVISLSQEPSTRALGPQHLGTELLLSEEGMAALSRLLEPAFFGRRRRTA